jgi:hypothetical protein
MHARDAIIAAADALKALDEPGNSETIPFKANWWVFVASARAHRAPPPSRAPASRAGATRSFAEHSHGDSGG